MGGAFFVNRRPGHSFITNPDSCGVATTDDRAESWDDVEATEFCSRKVGFVLMVREDSNCCWVELRGKERWYGRMLREEVEE